MIFSNKKIFVLALIFLTISCTFEDDDDDSYKNFYNKHVLPQIKFGSVLKTTGNCEENEDEETKFLFIEKMITKTFPTHVESYSYYKKCSLCMYKPSVML